MGRVYLVCAQFHPSLFKSRTIKEIAICDVENQEIYHWFIKSPPFFKNLYMTTKAIYYRHIGTFKRIKDELTYGKSLEAIREIIEGHDLVYATDQDTVEWLLSNVPCHVSANMPPLSSLITSKKRCSTHQKLAHISSPCAYNIISTYFKSLKTKN